MIDDLKTLMEKSRVLLRKDPTRPNSLLSEDRRFRETFGCGSTVVLNLWNMLQTEHLVPVKGTLEHLLRALMFMKVYPTENILATLSGTVDPKTNRMWNWLFISAIADLEAELVSILNLFFIILKTN